MDAIVIELVRKARALAITGYRHATFQKRIQEALLPPPVKISERCSAWPLHELAAVNRAIVAGAPTDEIKRLVSHLVEARRPSTKDPDLVARSLTEQAARADGEREERSKLARDRASRTVDAQESKREA